jgi:hypothetical protein
MTCRGWLLGLAVLAGLSTAQAASSVIPIRLELAGPARCSSVREMLDALQRRQGRVRLATTGEDAVTLKVRLREVSGQLRGELAVLHDNGLRSERGVAGATCQAVVDALSWTAALALTSVAPDEREAAAGTTLVRTPPALATQSAARKPRAASSRVALEAGAQAALGQMVAPHLNVGGGLLGRARLERSSAFSPSLTVSVLHTRNELLESSKHAELRVTGLSVSVCPVSLRPHERLRFEPCFSATAAQLAARGPDLLSPRTVTRSWWGAGALARLSVSPLRHLSIEFEGGGLLPLINRRFVVSPTGESLGATPAIAPVATAGLVYSL